jgi:PAS domain S-box-containing protein
MTTRLDSGRVDTTPSTGSGLKGRFRARVYYGSPLRGYSLAVAFFLFACLLRVVQLRGGFQTPFLALYLAIALVSFLAGVGPGLATLILGVLFANRFVGHPLAPVNWIALAVFGPSAVLGFAHLRQIREQGLAAARELARFKFMGDHASDWILLLRESGHIIYANRRAFGDMGWSDGELVGRRLESLVPEEQRARLAALLKGSMSGAVNPIEIAFERVDGSVATMELGCTAVLTPDDRVIYAVARDVGERKSIDRKLQEVRRWESLGVLAGGIAHDFNNMLTSILGNASLAKELVPADHELSPLLAGIVSASERSADLVRLLLATSGYRSRSSESAQLDQVLNWVLANRQLPPRVRVLSDVGPAPLSGDRRAFETLLWSLIMNAAEAYGDQGGDVQVTIRHGLPSYTAGASFEEGEPGPEECLCLIVEDAGSGMPPEVLDRAFDPFYSTKFTGRGLGLPAVRGIVRAHSGKLWLRTEPGKGTRVEVWLPAMKLEANYSSSEVR